MKTRYRSRAGRTKKNPARYRRQDRSQGESPGAVKGTVGLVLAIAVSPLEEH